MYEAVSATPRPEIAAVESDGMRGARLMRRADMLTRLRSDSAVPLGMATALTDESFLLTAAVGGSMATDWLDGYYARQGAELLGVETTPEGAVSDPKADKDLINALMLGLIARYLRQKDYVAAAVVGANYLVTQVRDKRMECNRQDVVSYGLNPGELKAKTINKVKMAKQAGAIETLISPLAKDRRVRLGALAALSAGTAIGWVGERIVRRRVRSLIALSGVHP